MILTALKDDFEGVFSPRHTEFFENHNGEYFVRDLKFGFEGHTFIKIGDVAPHAIGPFFERRIMYLKRKFLEDIAEGGFIFLYYYFNSNIDNHGQLIDLSRALSPNNNNFLLVLDNHENSDADDEICYFERKLLIGKKMNATTFNSKPSTYMKSWRKICAAALAQISYIHPDWTARNVVTSAGYPRSMKLSNVAFGRYATQSSVLPWATDKAPSACAVDALSGTPTGMPNVHTDVEDNPWWMVDLGAVFAIHEIRLYSRLDDPSSLESMTKLKIDAALPCHAFDEIFRLNAERPFGGIDGNYLSVKFDIPIIAQRIRVQLTQRRYLHLDQVFIYGESSPFEFDIAGRLTRVEHWIEA